MSRVKKQHYVPQFYLRNFASRPGKVWLFDKVTKKSFEGNISNHACENYFYDNSNIDKEFGEQFIEKELGKLESIHSKLIVNFIHDLEGGKKIVSNDFKSAICEVMAFQILRTKAFRDLCYNMVDVMRDSLLKKRWFTENQLDELSIIPSSAQAKSHHLQHLLPGYDSVKIFSEILQRHILIVYKNYSNIPFHTSDNPISKYPHKIDSYRSYNGFGAEGIEISYPLNPVYNVTLCERTYFSSIEHFDCTIKSLDDPKYIDHFNYVQAYNALQYIYSSSSSFDKTLRIAESGGLSGAHTPIIG